MKLRRYTILILLSTFSTQLLAQVNESQLGGWYMYFGSVGVKDSPWGFQGDIQYRNWNLMGDLEQLLLRGGATYQLEKSKIKFTLGYASITTGTPGERKTSVHENRIYQEALIPGKLGKRFYLKHRLRFEQRFVESVDFKTRFRYALFTNIPLNRKEIEKGTLYLALYDELFMVTNGFFDRNRFYAAAGFKLTSRLSTQVGYMIQSSQTLSKGQLQVSLHQSL
ncbi:MAG: DUF2490 domain-containing protein [Bacteroidota bacterium]